MTETSTAELCEEWEWHTVAEWSLTDSQQAHGNFSPATAKNQPSATWKGLE